MRKRKSYTVSSPYYGERGGEKIIADNFSWSQRKIFMLCLVFRMLNSLLVQTYFNPDEHWQALEVAHRISFGYGHLTWEWKKGLRSYLHPMLFSALYSVLAFLRLDSPLFMVRAPRLLQSVLAAFGDLYLYKLSEVLFGSKVANWALFAQLTNWFMFFSITRTFSNCIETVLTIGSLYHWSCIRVSSSELSSCSRKHALTVAALACAIRPTSAITWIYVGVLELLVAHDKLKFVFLEVIPIGFLSNAIYIYTHHNMGLGNPLFFSAHSSRVTRADPSRELDVPASRNITNRLTSSRLTSKKMSRKEGRGTRPRTRPRTSSSSLSDLPGRRRHDSAQFAWRRQENEWLIDCRFHGVE